MDGISKTEVPVRASVREGRPEHPRKHWLHKALFQLHLWTGIVFALYILLMSVSGSVLIFRVEISRASVRTPPIVPVPGGRMTVDQLKQAAARAYPKYQVKDVIERRNPNRPVEISLQRGGKELQRLFNPFTGADLGAAVPPGFRFIEWLADLHDNLLYEPVGHIVNGVGGLAATLLCFTGVVIWWRGIDKWRRGLTVRWKEDARRLNWALHRALGMWSLVFIFLWGISGIYLAVPEPFETAVAFFDPVGKSSRKAAFGEQVLSWLARLHFGRFGGLSTKLIWTIFGLAPVVLVFTGTWMWWERVLRPSLARRTRRDARPVVARSDA
jgi:uncharacterized iron-regulated membrane protein